VTKIKIDGRHVLIVVALMLVNYYSVFSFYFRYDTFTWLDKTMFDPIDWHYFLDVNKASPYFTPMGNVLFYAMHKLFGLEPFWYHACMFAIHALNAFLVYCFAIRILGSNLPAFLAALLFGVFPAHVDAVVYVATIHHTLATAFILLSFLSFTRFLHTERKRHFYLMLIFFALGLLTKQIACVIPALCAGYEYVALRNRMSKSSLAKYIPLGFVLAIYLGVNSAVNRANTAYAPIHATYYIVDYHIFGSFVEYLRFMTFPVDTLVSAVAKRFLPLVQTLYAYLRTFLFVVFMALVAHGAVKRREIRFALLWVSAALLPSLPFVFPPQSRYVYLASIGFCAIVASMATTKIASSKLLRAVMLAALVVYSIINFANMHSFARDYDSWRQWISEIRAFYPYLPPNSDLYLVDFPRLAISRDDEISSAVRVAMGNPTLRVHALSLEEYSQLGRSAASYALRYEKGHFTDQLDMIMHPALHLTPSVCRATIAPHAGRTQD
jgi:hypothetical protein